jgi:cytochrome P450
VLLAADDIETVLADPRFVTLGLEALERLGISDGPFHEWRGRTLNVLNGDDHTRLRSYIGRVFTPRQVERMRPIVAEHAGVLLDRIVARAGDRAAGVAFDLVAGYADDLPLVAICRFLGIDDADRHEIAGFLAGTEEGFTEPMTPEARRRAESSIVALYRYVEALLAERAVRPRDDVISMLAAEPGSGDVGGAGAAGTGGAGGIDPDERLALVVNLVGGAVGSSRSAIVNSVLALVRHPAQADRLRADRTLLRAAIEECLRLHPPFRVGRRKTVEPVDAFGLSLPAGATVFFLRASANRDPARFDRPDELDIGRAEARHLSFGHGPHFCLGQALARLDVQEAVWAVLDRFERIELAVDDPDPLRVPFTMDERLSSLPLVGYERS